MRGHGGLEPFGEGAVVHEDRGGGVRQAELLDVATLAVVEVFRDLLGEARDGLARDLEGRDVRIREGAVVVGVFLVAQDVTTGELGVPAAGLLRDRAAGFEFADLAGGLVDDRVADARDRVEVLGLGAGAEFRGAPATDGHVAIAAQLALLHVAISDAGLGEHRDEGAKESLGFGRGTQVRLGDDLEERHAGAVVVDQRAAARVAELAHVFLEVGMVDADELVLAHHIARGARELDLDLAADDDREILLSELVVLRIIRVEIVLTVPSAALRDLRAHDEAEEDGLLDRLAVHHRQRAGESEDDRVDLFVGFLAEAPGGRREDLGAGVQLHVDLEADDDFPIRRCVAHRAACWWAKPWAASKRRPAARSLASESGAPTRWKPTGRWPDLPQGTEIAGRPARLAGIVKMSSR